MNPGGRPDVVPLRSGVTWRPHAARTQAAAPKTSIRLRSIGASTRFAQWAFAAIGAVALALAFPKPGQAWLAPLGAAGLFWAWRRLSWKRAFVVGWFAGTIFFTIDFSWFTYTVGAYVGKLAFAVVLIPAIVEGLAFAAAAACSAYAARVSAAWAAPAAGAAAFTVFEYLRSIGPLAVPFAQIGYSQTPTQLALFAPYAGAFGVTFVVMLLGATIADAVARRSAQRLAVTCAIVLAAWIACYLAWPARRIAAPGVPVAAVQGNITQSLKQWTAASVNLAMRRYLALTAKLGAFRPALVVWPETVLPADLNDADEPGVDPAAIVRTLEGTASDLHATLAAGAFDVHDGARYNALFLFGPDGAPAGVYDKRQLVPFTESFPGRAWLSWLPDSSLIGTLGAGRIDAVFSLAQGLRFAPLICWESAFADLVHAQIRNGAQILVIPTDDAWFGESSGTYQHAQIAQMRAIESGEWVVQAASTGISGIIAPDGTWRERSQLDRRAVVLGNVGLPVGSLFARIGPAPVAAALALLYAILIATGLRGRAR